MPETKACPSCGQLCDRVIYRVTPEMAGDAGEHERQGAEIEVWECPDVEGCGWEEDVA